MRFPAAYLLEPAPLVWSLGFLAHAVQAETSFDPFSASSSCPISCDDNLSQWTQYSSVHNLDICNKTVLFRCNLYNEDTNVPVQACVPASSSQEDSGSSTSSLSLKIRHFLSLSSSSVSGRAESGSKERSDDVQLFKWAVTDAKLVTEDLIDVASVVSSQLKSQSDKGEASALFAKKGDTIMGTYAGSEMESQSIADMVDKFAKWGSENEGASQVAAQICTDDSSSRHILGLFMDASGDVNTVQGKLRDWGEAKCISSKDAEADTWKDIAISTVPNRDFVGGGGDNSTNAGNKVNVAATCKATTVKKGDGCWSVAKACKISENDFKKYNKKGICDSMEAGDHVCCSSGSLPDFSPQPNPDGSCKTHTITKVDDCDTIARKNDMSVDQIKDRNKKTWGWAGCQYLVAGAKICLSKGDQPMPSTIQNATCGPQVPGTKKPTDMSDLAALNPCPLKSCCNVWGNCGITEEFCVPAPADTGAPGTSKPGKDGCIFNCGMKIVNNDDPPKEFIKVGYFESWNRDRPCLHMRASQIDTDKYTHVHFAFGNITGDYDVDVSGQQDAYDDFKGLKDVKRILSFGGWSFSTDADTAPIFRKGVTTEQRQTFAKNVIAFIEDQGLDGVDFDWEYPGAPDIPGIPPGDKDDGKRYLEFLKLVRDDLPDGKLMGIAAPASYWYLKGFPIGDIGKVVDYIIYMTYDMHGQWDYGSEWAAPGCKGGNCLRSHINTTETESALVMITKAGVQSNKVIIGMPYYGRSFKMSKEGCWGPDCNFEGPDSKAKPGRCTETRGYISNFELREIIASGKDVEMHSTDEGDILVYDKTEWVAWMSPDMYQKRTDWVKGLNFGGLSDWAIDLDADYAPGDGPGGGDEGSGAVFVSPDIYDDGDDAVISCYPPCTVVLPPLSLSNPTTISPKPATVTYEENWSTTITVSDQPITTSMVRVTSTVITIPPLTTTEIPLWEVTWSDKDDKDTAVYLNSSITFPPVTLTRTKSDDDDTRPPITWTYIPQPYPTRNSDNPDDPDPPGPPPPPPKPWPSKISIKPGAPKPTCKPGEKGCGKPCRSNCDPTNTGCVAICGCIGPFCPDGSCVGAGCNAVGGSPGDPDECRRRSTVSDCRVPCTVKKMPSTTTTYCSKSICSNTRFGCSITGKTSTSTTTASCSAYASIKLPDPDSQVPIVGEGEGADFLWQSGPYEPPADPTSTEEPGDPDPTDPALPTLTPGTDEGPYCFRKHNGNDRYDDFDADAAETIIKNVCSNKDLNPGNTLGYVSKDDDSGLIGMVSWAEDQDGCPKKSDVKLGDNCLDALRYIGMQCGDFDDPDKSYGGAFIEKVDEGCVEWFVGIDSARKALRANGVDADESAPTLTAKDFWGKGASPMETGVPRAELYG